MRLIAVMTLLVPSLWRDHPDALTRVAEAIESVTESVDERAALAAVDFAETGWETHPRAVAFGLSGLRQRPATLRASALRALEILRVGRARCRGRAGMFGYFHHGRCALGAYERRLAGSWSRMRRLLQSSR